MARSMALFGWYMTPGKVPKVDQSATGNVDVALEYLGWTPDHFCYDEWFKKGYMLIDGEWQPIDDNTIRSVWVRISKTFGHYVMDDLVHVNYNPNQTTIRGVIDQKARGRSYNSQRDAFRQATWDGVDRWPMLAALVYGLSLIHI